MNKMKYIIVVVKFYTVFIINHRVQYNSDIILAVMTDDSDRHRTTLQQTSLYFEQMKVVRSVIEGLCS